MGACYFCKGTTIEQETTVDYRWGDKLIVIKNVPAEVCSQCGEKYFDAEVSRQMEAMALGKEKPHHTITVSVCEFARS